MKCREKFRGDEMLQCANEAAPGRTRCIGCLKRQAAAQARHRERYGRKKPTPRPAWMDDVSLLPKRPPGMESM